jgi:glycerol-3-phosphate dehydrogenase
VTSALSRDHAVLPGPKGLTTIVGGKYTTYRRMAEDAVNAALAPLGLTMPSRTATLPLVGAERWAQTKGRADEIALRLRLSEDTVRWLLVRHGDRIDDLLALAAEDASLARPIDGAPRYLKAELLYAVRAEGARSLADVMLRRTHLSIELPDGGLALAPQVTALIAPELGWDEARCADELRRYRELIAAERAALDAACGRG